MSLSKLEEDLKDSRLLTYHLLAQLVEYRPSLVDDLADLYGDKPSKVLKDIRLGKWYPTWEDYKHIYNL